MISRAQTLLCGPLGLIELMLALLRASTPCTSEYSIGNALILTASTP